MSKNTGSTKFRKIDVDQYNEDRYEDDNAADEGPQGPNEGEVTSMLSTGRNQDALQNVLNNAPVTSKNVSVRVKDKAGQLVMRVLLSFKSSEMESAIQSLNDQQIDILMKYIYKGFENPTEGSSAALLTWHEKAFTSGGLGSIVRVLTDRKKV